jgi:hypothetical protein
MCAHRSATCGSTVLHKHIHADVSVTTSRACLIEDLPTQTGWEMNAFSKGVEGL